MTDTVDIVFDTDCVLCCHTVTFILAHERDARFRFFGAWSPEGQAMVLAHDIAPERLDETFAVIVDGNVYLASDGALEIARSLGWPWSWARVFRLIPKSLRDWVYFVIARNRYRLWGQRETCFLPPPEASDRFIGIVSRRGGSDFDPTGYD